MSNAAHCDGPSCDSWSRSPFTTGFLEVWQAKDHVMHFCSWDCVLRYGAFKTPTEVISND